MIGNPEFTRNIWLQFSWPRLLAAIVVIGILYYAVSYFGDAGDAAITSGGRLIFGFIIAVWGTRRAADALAEEVGSNTWEMQRMSGLSAWQMAWGKLLGGTAFPWFCGLLFLAFMDVTKLRHGSPINAIAIDNIDLILNGLNAHAASLSVALMLLRKAQLRRRLMVTFAQVCGLLVYANLLFRDLFEAFSSSHQISWFGQSYADENFRLVSTAVFGLWIWFGLYRLMRLELQYRNLPWAWIGFVVYLAVYVAGFSAQPGQPVTAMLTGPLVVGIVLTYLSFLAEPKDPVRYRWGVIAFVTGDLGKALSFVPLWLLTYLMTVAVGISLATLLPSEPLTDIGQTWLKYLWSDFGPRPQILVIAALLFLARDILFLLLLNFSSWRQRADVAGLIYLLIAYFPLASIIGFVGSHRLLPIVMPYDAHNMVMTFAPVCIEVLALAIAVSRRWRLLVAIKPRPMLAA